jgi:spore coat protein, CotS family
MPSQAELYDYDILSEENIKRYVLPLYGLENSNISQIKFKDTDKQRAVYKLDYLENSYCLKKVYYKEPDLLFVYSAIEWLHRNNVNVPRMLPTLSNGRYAEYNNMLFILTPWIDGIRCSYDNIDHVIKSSSTLAKIHNCGTTFKPIAGSTNKKNLENIPLSLQKHFQQLLNSSNLAFKYKDNFSKIFLKNFDNNIYLAHLAINIASTVEMNNLNVTLCHLDYVNKNIIFDSKEDLWVIDFDKCKIDYSVHDIAYFLRRILKRDNTKWSLDLTINALDTYNNTREISLNEYKLLIAYLSFPQKYWKISRDYYNNINKCNKNSFITLLNKSVEKIDFQIQFIDSFKKYIENKFNTKID